MPLPRRPSALRHLCSFSSVCLEDIKRSRPSQDLSLVTTALPQLVHGHLVFLIGTLLYHGRSTIPHTAHHQFPSFIQVPHAVPLQHNPHLHLWSVVSLAAPREPRLTGFRRRCLALYSDMPGHGRSLPDSVGGFRPQYVKALFPAP